MDLFIIIAAVLGVGGVVSASVYNLVNSATSNASVAVVGASVVGGYSAGGTVAAPSAIAITIKNNGGSPITCTSTTCSVTLAGTNEGTGTPAPSINCLPTTCLTSSPTAGPIGWMITGPAVGIPLQFTAGATGFTLAPGAQTSFVVNGMTGTLGSSPSMPAHGASVTLNVIFGTASAQVSVIAQ